MNNIIQNLTRFTAASTLLLSASVLAGEEIDETRAMSPGGLVSIENPVGEVEVSGWNRDEVRITGELSEHAEQLEIQESGNGIRISVRYPRRNKDMSDSELTVRVPMNSRVDVETISADIEVSDLDGERVTIVSVSGDILVDVASEHVELSSVSGDVEYTGNSIQAAIETVSGDIEVSGAQSDVSLKTVSGDMALSDSRLVSGRFQAVSGHIDVAAELESGARLTAENLSGDIEFSLPGSVSARLEASSYSGEIESAYGRSQKEGRRGGESFNRTLGDGEGQISLQTFSGDIEIRSR